MTDHEIRDLAPFLRGHVELEPTARGTRVHRLPAWARSQCPDPQLLMVESQPAGVRLAVRTAASRVGLDVVATKREYVGAGRRPDGVYELEVRSVDDAAPTATAPLRAGVPDGDVVSIDLATGRQETRQGPVGTVGFDHLPPGEKDLVLWLPHNESTELVALRADAPLEPVAATGPRWLHHGSSISQGSNATLPTATWPVVAAGEAGVELTNLGFGGSALLDPFTARTVRDLQADLVSLEVGINLVNTDLMRRRAFGPALHGFLDTVREGHPDTPLVLLSPLLCPIHEDVPGPSAMDPDAMRAGTARFVATGDPAQVAAGALTLSVVRTAMDEVVDQRRDLRLRLVDGRDLYGWQDHGEHPLPDGLHPDGATHRLIGHRFAHQVLAHALGPR